MMHDVILYVYMLKQSSVSPEIHTSRTSEAGKLRWERSLAGSGGLVDREGKRPDQAAGIAVALVAEPDAVAEGSSSPSLLSIHESSTVFCGVVSVVRFL